MDSAIHFNLLILALLTSVFYLLYSQSKNETLGSRQQLHIYSLTEQPQLLYSILNTLRSPGSTLILRLGETAHLIHTSPLYSSWTQPDLWLTTNPIWPGGDKVRVVLGPRAVLAVMHQGYMEGWDTWRGSGLPQHTRIHCQDPSTGGFLPIQSSLVFLSKAGHPQTHPSQFSSRWVRW